ncbi:hypothetical protein [Micromonospora chokoriensis]|uniref:hypothetical protein n=1 Tax=Micromonospora chokoriensis TaxID=356851 RepID=UPI0004C3D30B|nr:hypothetical protein [Micromonospora chokoriensis]
MADAIVLAGRMFGPGAPLPMYAGDVAELRGATVHRHSWTQESPSPNRPEIEDWVRGEVTPLIDRVGGRPLLMAKSLGTNAAVIAAERSLPAVWLTPVLTMPWVLDAMRRATAPFLLVGGTADKLWDGDAARRLSPHVFEVADADHGMYVPGPLTESIAVLGQVVVAIEAFLDEIAWP